MIPGEEDDWAHDFGITSTPTPVAANDDRGHVIYLRSLTKSVSPAIRVAAVIARGPARERILADCDAESMYVSGLLQTAGLDVVTQPGRLPRRRAHPRRGAQPRDLIVAQVDVELAPCYQGAAASRSLQTRRSSGSVIASIARTASALSFAASG